MTNGRAPSGQALVSDEARSGLHPSGFDPSRIRNPQQPWRKLSQNQLWTLEAAANYRGIFLSSKDLCGYVSSSPDSLWRLGYLEKQYAGLERQPRYRITDSGLAVIAQEKAR